MAQEDAYDVKEQLEKSWAEQERLISINVDMLDKLTDMHEQIRIEQERISSEREKEKLREKTKSLEERLNVAQQLQLDNAQRCLRQQEGVVQGLHNLTDGRERVAPMGTALPAWTSTQGLGQAYRTPNFEVSQIVPETVSIGGVQSGALGYQPTQIGVERGLPKQRRHLPAIPCSINGSDSESDEY